MAVEGDEQETVTVKTYVSTEQRNMWRAEADELDMSLSEFVASMVQAGRRDFDLQSLQPSDENATPGGLTLEQEVLDALATDGPMDWDDLIGELRGDFEKDLDATLETLQDENRIRYSGRKGGYDLKGESDE